MKHETGKKSTETLLKQFVSGEISAEHFADLFYQNVDEFETYFSNFPRMAGYLENGILLFLMSCNLHSITGKLNAVGAIEDFFKTNNIQYKKNKKHEKGWDFLSKVQPKYLDVDLNWIESHYSNFPQWEDQLNREKWLKERIKEDFQYVKKPPKWIQSPNWIIGENGPYTFIGQFDVTPFFHDTTFLYVFLDATNKDIKTVLQSF